jgi:hypothetical protein
MSDRWDKPWDEEPYGDPDNGRRRRWRRPWNVYLCYVVGAFGLFMTMGAVAVGSPHGIAAGLCVLAVPVALVLADGPRARPAQPPPTPPSLAVELSWYAVAILLVVVGFTLASK